MTTPNAPSLWSSGVEWDDEATAGADAYWLADDWNVGMSGRAHVFVSIAGALVNGFGDDSISLQGGTWALGRNDWFDVLTPGTASFTFSGVIDAVTGDEVVVSCESGVLWIGNVGDIDEAQDVSGEFRTTITATDRIGRLGKTVKPPGTLTISAGPKQGQYRIFYFAGETLETMANEYLTDYSGDTVTVTVGDSVGTLPTLIDWYDPPEVTLLELLNQLERTSNAMMALQPDGSILVVMRDAVAASEVPILDLVSDDAPYSWVKRTAAANVINHWSLVQPAYDPDVILDETDADSVDLYGDRTYAVDNYLCDTATHFGSGLKAAMAVPRAIVTDGRFHIHDLSQNVLALAPLAWVKQADDTWQVMSVRHEFGGSSWDMSITADVSQNAMTGAEDPDEEPDAGVTIDTQSITSTKATTVALSSAGSRMGNGAGNYLPVGYYAGFRTRALIEWSVTWPSGFIRVKSCKMGLRTSTQVWVAFGSSPRFYTRRITGSWPEGTFDAAAPNQYSATNATVWPGPSKTISGQALKTIGTSENNDISVDIADIAQACHDAGENKISVMLISANEDSATRTIEFWSDDTGTTAARPSLTLKCEVSS